MRDVTRAPDTGRRSPTRPRKVESVSRTRYSQDARTKCAGCKDPCRPSGESAAGNQRRVIFAAVKRSDRGQQISAAASARGASRMAESYTAPAQRRIAPRGLGAGPHYPRARVNSTATSWWRIKPIDRPAHVGHRNSFRRTIAGVLAGAGWARAAVLARSRSHRLVLIAHSTCARRLVSGRCRRETARVIDLLDAPPSPWRARRRHARAPPERAGPGHAVSGGRNHPVLARCATRPRFPTAR